MNLFRFKTHLIIYIILLLTINACAPSLEIRGYITNQDIAKDLTPGSDNKETVLKSLGTPTSVGTFSSNTWYYITRLTEKVSFLNEKVTDQYVVVLNFNKIGILESVESFDLEDSINITPVERTTPTHGRELGIIEQILGNINRFEPPPE